MSIHHPIAPSPTGTLAAEIVATIRERARQIEPYHPARSRWVALKAAADMGFLRGFTLIREALMHPSFAAAFRQASPHDVLAIILETIDETIAAELEGSAS